MKPAVTIAAFSDIYNALFSQSFMKKKATRYYFLQINCGCGLTRKFIAQLKRKSFESCCFANVNYASAKKYRSSAKQIPPGPNNLAQCANENAQFADKLVHRQPLHAAIL